MRLSKWTLLAALLAIAALSLAGCMNAGNRVDTVAPSPSAGTFLIPMSPRFITRRRFMLYQW